MTNDIPDDEEEIAEIRPGDPDYDLSEAHGYTWEPDREGLPIPQWVLVGVSLLLVIALLVPGLIFFLQHV